ncbi:MAG: DUF2934 domain-containing protein [Acidobacteriia bacterium]|nr:DUF2934 domain-containing protein [Terriglobia bacterium]
MARKTTGITTRSKKTVAFVPPAPVELAPETRKNGNTANVAPGNLEEEIRRRAYELYLERRATAGAGNGDENQDWLVAEREIRSRQGGQDQQSA